MNALLLAEERMDVKTFMEFHGIGLWTDHERLVHIFEGAGFRVIRIERSSVCWSLQLLKPRPNIQAEQVRRFIRDFLRKQEIRLDRHEPLFRAESTRMWVYFQTTGGEIGLGLKLAECRRGALVPCHEEYRLPDYECYPAYADAAEVLALPSLTLTSTWTLSPFWRSTGLIPGPLAMTRSSRRFGLAASECCSWKS